MIPRHTVLRHLFSTTSSMCLNHPFLQTTSPHITVIKCNYLSLQPNLDFWRYLSSSFHQRFPVLQPLTFSQSSVNLETIHNILERSHSLHLSQSISFTAWSATSFLPTITNLQFSTSFPCMFFWTLLTTTIAVHCSVNSTTSAILLSVS